MPKGFWMPVLHAHLPFVRHPEYSDALEERWLYEAIVETYIPLLSAMERLTEEKCDFRLTMSLTPPLCNMLSDRLLQDRALHYIQQLLELSEKELIRTRYVPEFQRSAEMYHRKFKEALHVFEKIYHKNLLIGFKKFQDLGRLEIITCSATHGFLPLMQQQPNSVRAQILTAVRDYERHFGRPPRGMWNAECGFYPGLEDFLSEGGIRYFFTDTHGLLHASEMPKYGVFAPMTTPNGIAFFGRDMETSQAVWSSNEGYPGNPNYREFYRDVGFDLEYDYIKPYIHESGLRISTGIKYHRVTSKSTPMEYKEPYHPEMAQKTVMDDALHFTENRYRQIDYLSTLMPKPPVVVSMYDAELFGHWWYEGPDFLYHVLKNFSRQNDVIPLTPSEYLHLYPETQTATPPLCSWGFKGYSEFWLNGTNDWIYPHLHRADERMAALATRYRHETDPLIQRALNQAGRELLLAQSSDWAFIMRTNTMVDYAIRRTRDHLGRFHQLADMIEHNRLQEKTLRELEYRDNLFQDMDYRVYADR